MDGQLDGKQTGVDEILPGTIDQNLRTGKILSVRGDDLEADGEPEACPYAVVIVVRMDGPKNGRFLVSFTNAANDLMGTAFG